MTAEELGATVRYQISALLGLTKAQGGKVDYVKPHGALYNHISEDKQAAKVVVRAIRDIDPELKIMGLAGSHMKAIIEADGSTFIAEAFADRAYEEDGKLRSRKLAGAVYDNPEKAVSQVVSVLKNEALTSYSGQVVSLKAESFCIHGDNPAAIKIAQALRSEIEQI